MTPREYREQARRLRQKSLERRRNLAKVIIDNGVVHVPPSSDKMIILEATEPQVKPTTSQPSVAPKQKQGCSKCRRKTQ